MVKFIKGFLFAMLIQIAVGPVCIFVFNTAVSSGFASGMSAVCAVTIVDGLFILAALIGIATIFSKKHSEKIKYIGAVVLILFSIYMIISALLSINTPVPRDNVQKNIRLSFLQAFVITAANPLTIVFWAGVFGTKLSSEKYNRKDTILFSLGCVNATPFFLGIIAVAGSLLQNMLHHGMVIALNTGAGCFILLYGIRMLLKKKDV
jgi:threonine/homoserine/homoserine lactone efflux protein